MAVGEEPEQNELERLALAHDGLDLVEHLPGARGRARAPSLDALQGVHDAGEVGRWQPAGQRILGRRAVGRGPGVLAEHPSRLVRVCVEGALVPRREETDGDAAQARPEPVVEVEGVRDPESGHLLETREARRGTATSLARPSCGGAATQDRRAGAP